MHLAEAAKHLRAAGIPVSPEMLEKFSQRSSGKPGEHPWFSHRGQSDGGSPGGFGERPHFPSKDGAAPAGAPRFDAMQKHFGSRFGRPGFPPAPGMGAPGQPPVPHMPGTAPEGPRVNAMHRGFGGMQGMHERQAPSPGANPGPGAGPAPDAVQNEIRALAKQVQELRAMIQQRGGAQNPAPMPRGGGFQSPDSREHHAAPGAPGAPGANPERRDFPQRAPGEHHPRTEGGHPNPPGNPAIPGERPRGDAPQPR